MRRFWFPSPLRGAGTVRSMRVCARRPSAARSRRSLLPRPCPGRSRWPVRLSGSFQPPACGRHNRQRHRGATASESCPLHRQSSLPPHRGPGCRLYARAQPANCQLIEKLEGQVAMARKKSRFTVLDHGLRIGDLLAAQPEALPAFGGPCCCLFRSGA
jgi:hypothetical protein